MSRESLSAIPMWTVPIGKRCSEMVKVLWLVLPLAAMAADSGGERQFRIACAPCHGPQGEGGRGPPLAAATLPRAPDDAALSTIIATGIPGTQMPATRMTADQRQ